MKNNLNLLFAAIFMMGFLVFWDSVVMKRYSSGRPGQVQKAASADAQSKLSLEADVHTAITTSPNTPKEESLTVLETPDTKVSFLSKGARIVSWHVKERSHWIELVEPEKKREISPLETFPEVNFNVQKKSESEAIFTGILPNGVIMTKGVRLAAHPPFHELTVSFLNPTKQELSVNTALPLGNGIDKHVVGSAYDSKEESSVIAENRAVGLSLRVKSWKPGFIFGRTVDTIDNDAFQWIGVDNNHFLVALIANSEKINGVKVVANRKHPPFIAHPIQMTLKPGATWQESYFAYGGPKEYGTLKKYGYGLDQSVDFGLFGVISKILLRGLNFFESLTGNYGWAIIILTFCIQLLVFPLTKKNLQHSARMKELQPQIKKLQEQYKEDPKRQQVEMFNFYKRNGMRFMGMEGCFPMLLQLPVFFAFYSTLRVAYELRGAPWIFWVKDLGAHDPYYVLPIIMGIGMFLQQKLTAVAADPAQARMMMFMPIMFTFMFLKLPAGLVLYWCVNSLTTISIQKFIGLKNQSPSPA